MSHQSLKSRMAREEPIGTARDHTLILPCFPSCENCLTWSDDDALAFAAGPNVYLMTRKVDSTNTLTWTKDSLRVDAFTQEEHPQPDLATTSDLSLGEEQLDSVVVALAWSPPGLGLHCRAILAVLTSNLLLSIWETNGSQRGWRRTCIINHHLPTVDQNSSLPADVSSARRHLRIRSFAWSHPFLHATQPKWGSHFLAFVDDDNNLLFCKVEKSAKDAYGQWSIILLSTIPLGPGPISSLQDNRTSTMQQTLIQHSSVRSISIRPWKICAHEDASRFEARAVISCQRYHSTVNSTMLFEATVSEDPLATGSSNNISAALRGLTSAESTAIDPQSRHTGGSIDISYQLDNKPEWKEALEHTCHDYSKKNNLNGLFRVRFRGYATSPCHDIEAACVTLHPWDTYEYTPQGSEKCLVVFRPLQASTRTQVSGVESESSVLGRIIDFMRDLITSRDLEWNIIDRSLLLAYRKLMLSHSNLFDGQETLNASLKNFENSENGNLKVSAHNKDTGVLLSEDCTMCGSAIDMTLPITSAICQLGHHFTRCSLSLISIQEPSISKRCSGCNRQFLDIPKLRPLEGPSLAQELFDEFDVCPYCKGKYQG